MSSDIESSSDRTSAVKRTIASNAVRAGIECLVRSNAKTYNSWASGHGIKFKACFRSGIALFELRRNPPAFSSDDVALARSQSRLARESVSKITDFTD
ncbi:MULTISPECIES: hypothetical protein [Methylocaldum]|jgi:hypothetical protein|uniref:hypothetical protein n=1 Tax=unclassified Methylocaldum TaxID=2622260 RepID=UPI00105CD905|nr:hypothetical protein [Methylocaldum sp. RMAD-M]MBP1150663.1 hypothetical protein [Methylocaldum sp. RMAD-M]